MKLLIFGGTFNPPHRGHVEIARQACTAFSYDRIVFVPSFHPAHKEIQGAVSFEHRFAMADLAARELANAFVSDCEGRRKGISYTIDTVRFLKKEFSLTDNPGFIMGDDLVPGFHRWHKAEELVREADMIICLRENSRAIPFPWPHKYMENPRVLISSSAIREKIRAGENVRALLPSRVYSYIQKEGLYEGR